LLNHIDVEPILLKGAIALLPDQYPWAEDRVIGDLTCCCRSTESTRLAER